jgi:hypothetical protein
MQQQRFQLLLQLTVDPLVVLIAAAAAAHLPQQPLQQALEQSAAVPAAAVCHPQLPSLLLPLLPLLQHLLYQRPLLLLLLGLLPR